MRDFRIGLIGAGRIAQTYAQVIEQIEGVCFTAIADVVPEPAQAMGARLGADVYGSYRELAAAADVDAVLICTPPSTHPEIAIHFMEGGTHVICEKPLAINLSDAHKLVSVADDNGVLLTMASKFRYVDDVVRARSIVASGILGEIILVENAFTARVDMRDRWNADPAISGGGVLIDNGTHSVDLTRFFLGPIEQVVAVEGKRVQGLAVEDTAQLFLRSADGVRATVDLSWSINKELESYLDIYGSEGTVQVGWQRSRYRQTGSSDWVEFGTGYDKVQAIGDQMRNFARAANGLEALRITAADAIASVDVIDAAYRSLASSDWIPVRGEALALV